MYYLEHQLHINWCIITVFLPEIYNVISRTPEQWHTHWSRCVWISGWLYLIHTFPCHTLNHSVYPPAKWYSFSIDHQRLSITSLPHDCHYTRPLLSYRWWVHKLVPHCHLILGLNINLSLPWSLTVYTNLFTMTWALSTEGTTESCKLSFIG